MVICFLNYTGFSVVLKRMVITRCGCDFKNVFGEKVLSLGQAFANSSVKYYQLFQHMLKVDIHKTNILGSDTWSE